MKAIAQAEVRRCERCGGNVGARVLPEKGAVLCAACKVRAIVGGVTR